jgi:thiol-disulfide isomerase/thioredoxin
VNDNGVRVRVRVGLRRASWRVGASSLVLLALMATAASLAAQDLGIEIGARPRAVVIEDLEGNAVDLAQYIGKKPVVFEFWATWCPLCRALEPRLEAAKQQYGDRVEFVLIAVAVNQSKRAIQRHVERHAPPGRMLWDTEGRTTRALKAPSTSYIVILDREGTVTYTGVGEDQDILAAVSKVAR